MSVVSRRLITQHLVILHMFITYRLLQ